MTRPPAFRFETIHALDARTNVFLEVMTDHLKLSDAEVFDQIQQLLRRLTSALSSKGIEYERLRPALTPSTDRDERAFVFDSARCTDSLYGREAVRKILSLLGRESTHSVLCGDWLPWRGRFDEWASISQAALTSDSLPALGGSGETFYFVYLNHLTPAMTEQLDTALRQTPFYLGYLDLNLATPLKGCLATILVRELITHRHFVIRAHEDDRPDTEDRDLSLFELADLGFTIRSVPAMLYGPFLSYKIERPIVRGESDTRFSLNAITPTPTALSDFEIVLEQSKLNYLRTHKLGSLARSGLERLTGDEIADQIRAKIEANYIYSLSRSTDGSTLKFNIIMQFGTARTLCALEYVQTLRKLRVITFY